MPHLLVFKTSKVVLPYTQYKTTKEHQSLMLNNIDGIALHEGSPMFVVTLYQQNNRYADIGCYAEQLFYFEKDNNDKLKTYCCENLTGICRFSVQYLCCKPNIAKEIYEGAYGFYLKPKEENIKTNLQEEVLKTMSLSKEDILKKFNHPEYVLPNLSFCIVDKLFPGDNPAENEIRLTYLREKSENRRLRMLKKHLLSK